MMISPKEYQRAYELFRTLRTQQPEERRANLERLKEEDPKLAMILERLLAGDQHTDVRVDHPALGDHVRLDEVASTITETRQLVGQRLGQYHLKRIIATGGMGSVYEATQEKPHRTVAIKVIRRGIASRSAMRRFEYEAQILARLSHPNIAQIHEAGIYEAEDGEQFPYFVMEYVPDARPITTYAHEQELNTRQRLALFRQVCDAVHHGHQKGIIHRDLKPANILVNGNGDVKIIDFGVARSTDSDMAVTTLQTDVGQLIGTLQYMSPEQCEADPHDLDTRSDVYALGVVLYELLCEQLPYDVSSAAIHEAVNIVRQVAPVRPSSFNRMLKGDIETITLKALEKERERRYQSALDFSQDIKRYLNNETIMARPPSVVYQLRKFAQRHRTTAAALLGTLIALIVGVTGTTWQAARANEARADAVELAEREKNLRKHAEEQQRIAEEQRLVAKREHAIAEAVHEFMHQALTNFSPGEANMSVRVLIDRAAEEVEYFFIGQPLVEADVRDMIQAMYVSLGEYERAEPHVRQMLELWRKHYGEDNEKTLWGMNRLATLFMHHEDYDRAEAVNADYVQLAQEALGPDHYLTLQAINNLASTYYAQKRYKEAETLHRQVIERRERLDGEENAGSLLISRANLALALKGQGHLEESIAIQEQVLQTRRARGGDTANLAHCLQNIAGAYAEAGRQADALAAYEEAFNLREEHFGPAHPKTLDSLSSLAFQHRCGHDYEQTVERYLELIERQTSAFGTERLEVATSLYRLADTFHEIGDLSQMELYAGRALDIHSALENPDPKTHRQALESMVIALNGQGKAEETLDVLQQANAFQEETLPDDHRERSPVLTMLGSLLLRSGRPKEAEPLLRQAKAIIEVHPLPELDWQLAHTTGEIGASLVGQKRFDEAEQLLLQSHEELKQLPNVPPDFILVSVLRLVDLYEAADRPVDAAHWRQELERARGGD